MYLGPTFPYLMRPIHVSNSHLMTEGGGPQLIVPLMSPVLDQSVFCPLKSKP